MRRGFGWGAAILVVLLVVGVAIGAYNVGLDEGLQQTGSNVEVVRYIGGHGYGFFPFFLIFPLFFLALFAFKGAMWRRHWHDHDGHGPGGRGPGGHHAWEQGYEEWHRRQHESGGGTSAGGEPSDAA
jgi:uncharacterized membrane protein YhaH (DUF805 family)